MVEYEPVPGVPALEWMNATRPKGLPVTAKDYRGFHYVAWPIHYERLLNCGYSMTYLEDGWWLVHDLGGACVFSSPETFYAALLHTIDYLAREQLLPAGEAASAAL